MRKAQKMTTKTTSLRHYHLFNNEIEANLKRELHHIKNINNKIIIIKTDSKN